MLAVVMRAAPRPNRNLQQPGRPAQPDPEGVRQLVLNDPQQMNKLRQGDPELAAAVNDPTRWRETYAMRQRQAEESERERQNQIALLNEDPFNVEAQRKIEDIIRQDRVVENLQKAYDENPEGMTFTFDRRMNQWGDSSEGLCLTEANMSQYSHAYTCFTSTPRSTACPSKPSSTLAPRRPSCPPTAQSDVVSCD